MPNASRVVLVVAAITYNSWLLGAWLNPDLAHPIASELAAQGQPYAWVFRGADILTVLLLLFTAKRSNVFWWLFLASTVVEALAPLRCVEQFTNGSLLGAPECRDLSTWIHEISSVTAGIGSIGAVVVALMLGRRGKIPGVAHIVLSLVLTGWMALGMDGSYQFQRLSIATIAIWWVFAYEPGKGFGTIKHEHVRALQFYKHRS